MKKVVDEIDNIFELNTDTFFPGISVDCVILGFCDRDLKILLNKFNYNDQWMLPGGFVFKQENVTDAAYRILSTRTGLKDVFLRQFYTFGDCNRTKLEQNTKMLKRNLDDHPINHWFLQRFISVAYYVLVDYSKVKVTVDDKEEMIGWFSLHDIPDLYSDHNQIIEKAIKTLRQQIDYIPFGYELLPEKFTLTDLRTIYETLLDKTLDRRNFQRKILSLNLLDKLKETRKVWGSRPTTLYSFNKERYKEALEHGTSLISGNTFD